jgi:hypothetical protein
MPEDMRGGKGRKDEVGPYPESDAPVITPSEINSGTHPGSGSSVGQSDALKGVERAPRRGDEIDPENDALGG